MLDYTEEQQRIWQGLPTRAQCTCSAQNGKCAACKRYDATQPKHHRRTFFFEDAEEDDLPLRHSVDAATEVSARLALLRERLQVAERRRDALQDSKKSVEYKNRVKRIAVMRREVEGLKEALRLAACGAIRRQGKPDMRTVELAGISAYWRGQGIGARNAVEMLLDAVSWWYIRYSEMPGLRELSTVPGLPSRLAVITVFGSLATCRSAVRLYAEVVVST